MKNFFILLLLAGTTLSFILFPTACGKNSPVNPDRPVTVVETPTYPPCIINGFTCTPSFTPPFTATSTATATNSSTKTITFTATQSFTPTITRTPTNTFTATNSPTVTITPTVTNTATNALTPTPSSSSTDTPTSSFTPTNTNTFTFTPSSTPTITHTNTTTFTHTSTPTTTYTPTSTPTATATCAEVIGNYTIYSTVNASSGSWYFTQIQPSSSQAVSYLHYYTTNHYGASSGNVVMSLYTIDGSGFPNTVIAATNAVAVGLNGWYSLPITSNGSGSSISSTTLSGGVTYMLTLQCSGYFYFTDQSVSNNGYLIYQSSAGIPFDTFPAEPVISAGSNGTGSIMDYSFFASPCP